MSNVTSPVPLPALRGCLDLLLHQYRPTLALDENRLREAMHDFERNTDRQFTDTHTQLHA